MDVLIIGGGIVGAGIARDAAMRGMQVGLVEQHDFAYGTSSRSSRLLHGGLRYLAQGRLGLVREASVEKRILHRIAPHLAQPLPFLFPTHKDDRDWRLWQLKIGVKLYDALCGFNNLGRSSSLTCDQLHAKLPGLSTESCDGAVRYFDALTNDARLVLDTLRSAARYGAMVVNRCRYDGARREGDHWFATVVDELSGERFEVRTRWVVNAAGPWADRFPQSRLKLRLTKGVHAVVDASRLPLTTTDPDAAAPEAVVLTEGRRILFVLPWGKRVILGTTDTDHAGTIESTRCLADDIDYLLAIVNRAFPGAKLQHQDVKSAWAGLRPLIADKHGHPSDASRAHQILHRDAGWIDVAGGKLTTYRRIAEQVVDKILRTDRQRVRSTTALEPLVDRLDAIGVSSVIPGPVTRAAVEHYCRHEWATSLSDVMIRRTSWHYYLDDPQRVATDVAAWMQPLLGWTDEETAKQRAAYDREVMEAAARSSADCGTQTVLP